MTHGILSREEFRDTMDRLYETTDQGFKALAARLDVLNGRVGKSEVEGENHRIRLSSLEKEFFQTPRRRHDDLESTRITKREAALVAFGVSVIGALMKVTLMVGEFAVNALKAIGKH